MDGCLASRKSRAESAGREVGEAAIGLDSLVEADDEEAAWYSDAAHACSGEVLRKSGANCSQKGTTTPLSLRCALDASISRMTAREGRLQRDINEERTDADLTRFAPIGRLTETVTLRVDLAS
eukprot:scaffold83123_cov31-Tisochrysis_lutea.AAC.3